MLKGTNYLYETRDPIDYRYDTGIVPYETGSWCYMVVQPNAAISLLTVLFLFYFIPCLMREMMWTNAGIALKISALNQGLSMYLSISLSRSQDFQDRKNRLSHAQQHYRLPFLCFEEELKLQDDPKNYIPGCCSPNNKTPLPTLH